MNKSEHGGTPRKPGPGRPSLPMPEPIPDSLENVLEALVGSPPVKPDEWDYLKKGGQGDE